MRIFGKDAHPSRRSATAWNLFFHYAAVVLAFVNGILLVPLYLTHIPLHLYGAWLASGNILAWTSILDPGFSTFLMQKTGAAYGAGDRRKVRDLFASGVVLSGGIAVLVAATGISVAPYVPGWLSLNLASDIASLHDAFVVAVIGTALMILAYTVTSVNQGLLSSTGVGVISVSTNLVAIAATIIWLKEGWGLMALSAAIVIRGGGFTLGNIGYFVWRCIREIGWGFSLSQIGEILRLSGFSFIGRMGGLLSANIDAFVVGRLLGPEIVPVYVLTRRGPETVRMLLERPSTAVMPAVAHLSGEKDILKLQSLLLRLVRIMLWACGIFISGFVIFNDDFLRLWVGQALFAGHPVNMIICVSLGAGALITSMANLCFAMGNIKGNSIISLIEGCVFALAITVGVQIGGLIGVALAPLVSLVLVSSWYYPRRLGRMLAFKAKNFRELVRIAPATLMCAAAVTLLFWNHHPANWWYFGADVIGATGSYAILLCMASSSFRQELVAGIKYLRIST